MFHPPGFSILVELEFGVSIFCEKKENWRTWRKTLNARKGTITHSTHIYHAAGIEVGGERSHQCAIPATK